MGILAFFGGFLAVIIGIAVIAALIRRKLRSFSGRILGSTEILEVLSDLEVEESPRSLNGCDSLLLPQILRDFPDFDVNLAKTYARDYLTENLNHNEGFTIHNVVLARYLPTAVQKTIVMQAAVCWNEGGRKQQKRFDLNYTYLLSSNSDTVAANCPNCGGALGYGINTCPYCGSRISNVLGNTWQFTEMKES